MLKENSIHFKRLFLSVCLVIISNLFFGVVYAQSQDDNLEERISEYLTAIESIEKETDDGHGFLYKTYQTFISSNDSNSCPFTPSCSAYASEALKKHGLIKGILKTGDRLQRCNGGPTLLSDYPINLEASRLADPVD